MKRDEVKNYNSTTPLKIRKEALRIYMSPQINSKLEVDQIISLKGYEIILDVGCGYGDLLSYLSEKYPKTKLYGADISKTMIEEARKKQSKINYSVQNVENLTFNSETFDVVIAKHMLYHVDNIPQAISEIYRVLKPEGRFLITLHTTQKESRNNIESYKHFLETELHRKKMETISRINAETYSNYINKEEFKEIDKKIVFSSGDIKSSEPFIEYMRTFKEFFTPTPSQDEWEKALSKLKIELNQEIAEKGHITETYGMGFVLLQKLKKENGKRI